MMALYERYRKRVPDPYRILLTNEQWAFLKRDRDDPSKEDCLFWESDALFGIPVETYDTEEEIDARELELVVQGKSITRVNRNRDRQP